MGFLEGVKTDQEGRFRFHCLGALGKYAPCEWGAIQFLIHLSESMAPISWLGNNELIPTNLNS